MSVTILDAGYVAKHPSESSSEVRISPVARTCGNPLDQRESGNTKGDEDTGDGFEFNDLDSPLGERRFYALSPCECFGGEYGAAAPVSDTTYSTMPPGSNNKYIPASTMIVSGSLSCEPGKLLKTLASCLPKTLAGSVHGVVLDVLACQVGQNSYYFDVSTVRHLKERLAQLHGVPRFRQRLLDDGESLQDTATLYSTDLQLVFLNYSEASLEQAAELTAAVGHASASKVEEILQRPQDPNQADADGNTPLILAENVEIASLLLEAGANKDQARGHLDVVNLLLEAGADKDLANSHGTTPLMLAAAYGHVDVTGSLLEADVGIDLTDVRGITALMIAAITGNVEIGNLLLIAGVKKDIACRGGGTALMFAARYGKVDFVRLLLEAGAVKDLLNNQGKTASVLAAEHGHVEAASLLSTSEQRVVRWRAGVVITQVEVPSAISTSLEATQTQQSLVCRLYSGCGNLVQEVNSQGELYGVSTAEACLVADAWLHKDPEACRAHKREKWLAGEMDPVGDCLFEDLLSQCDTSLIHGGHGISECGSCTHMSETAKVVGLSKLKRPLPESFTAGSMLSVSCGTRFAGLNRFGNEPLSEQQIVCQDGSWVDPHGGPGLLALQCVACTRATPRAGSSLRDFMAASQQDPGFQHGERWWLQHHPVEIRSWNNLCLSSEIQSDSSVTISFTDPVDIAVSSRRRNIDSGGHHVSVIPTTLWGSGYSYGWTGDGGTCAFDQRAEVSGSFALSWSMSGDAQKIEDPVTGAVAATAPRALRQSAAHQDGRWSNAKQGPTSYPSRDLWERKLHLQGNAGPTVLPAWVPTFVSEPRA
eukprot:s456_g8.t2